MRAIPVIFITQLALLQSLYGQGIEGSPSLRDRSRVLQKKNPVSSETSGYAHFQGATSESDAEGASPGNALWNTHLDQTGSTQLDWRMNYTELSDNIGYNWRLRHSLRVGEEPSSGIAIDLGQDTNVQRFDSLQYLWSNDESENSPSSPTTIRFDQRSIETRKTHANGLAQLKLGDTRLFAIASWSEQDDQDQRLRLEYRLGPINTFQSGNSVLNYNSARIRKSLRQSPDIRTETIFAIGSETDKGQLKVETTVLKRRWKRDRPDIFTIQFQQRYEDQIELDITKAETPKIRPATETLDSRHFDYLEIRFEDNETNDEDFAYYLDATLKSQIGLAALNWKSGFIYREKTRNNFEIRRNYEDYPNPYTLSSAQADTHSHATLNGAYQLGPFPDAANVLTHFSQHQADYLYNPISSEQDSLSQNYNADERIFGIYLNLVALWKTWQISIGGRKETTEVDTFGYEIVEGSEGDITITPSEQSGKYDNEYPTLSLSRNLSQDSSLLFNWQRTVARPNYYDLIPYRVIARSSEVVRSGNPDLDPTLLETASLSYRKELDSRSSFSAMLSQTRLDRFIYSSEETILDGPYEGFKFRTTLNGDYATINGLDLSYSRALDPLKDKDKQILLNLLYQYKSSEAFISKESPMPILLPDVAKNKAQLSLEQTLGAVGWLLQFDYSSQALDQIGLTRETFEYLDQRLTVNAQLTYKFDQNWTSQLTVINLANSPIKESIGSSNRLGKVTYNSWQTRLNFSKKW